MSKVKVLGGKHPLVNFLSLGFMVFGIGCMAWAMFNIWSQSGYSGNYSIPTTFASELKELTINSTAPVQLNFSLVSPTPNKNLYPIYPLNGDNIGSLTIPDLNLKLPIIQGTGVKELKKGVGHFTQSVLPGEEDNCVLSGHRDTVFTQIGNLKIGDQLIVQTSAGTFIYEVNGTRIVHEDDKTVIVPTDHATLTMTTCYPFNVIGSAMDRYIVSSVLIKSKYNIK